MKLQIELNVVATEAWNTLLARPEFAMSTKASVVYQLMHHYLKPQQSVNGHAAPRKPSEPEEPKIGKVDLRRQQEAAEYRATIAAKIAAGIERARHGELPWPKREFAMSVDTDGCYRYDFPPEYEVGNPGAMACIFWTPPSDYPQELIDASLKSEAVYVQAMSGRPVDNDPPPNDYNFDDPKEYAVARAEWGARNF